LIPILTQQANAERRRLLDLFDRLSGQERATLLAFAQFLATHDGGADVAPISAVCEHPRDIPRPADETVVGAIKRLSQTYFMLDRRDMLNETSGLMAAHVLQGRPAVDVVNALEDAFRTRYERYRETWRT